MADSPELAPGTDPAAPAKRPAAVWAFFAWAALALAPAIHATRDGRTAGVVVLAVLYALVRGVWQRNRRQRITSQVMCFVSAIGAFAFAVFEPVSIAGAGPLGLSGQETLYVAAGYWLLGAGLLSTPSMRAHTQLDPKPR